MEELLPSGGEPVILLIWSQRPPSLRGASALFRLRQLPSGYKNLDAEGKAAVGKDGWLREFFTTSHGLCCLNMPDLFRKILTYYLLKQAGSFRLSSPAFILPIGISFYTFQAISYLTDVYRKDICFEPSLINFGMYICMFPQLIAGPIVTYASVRKQISARRHSLFTPWKNGASRIYDRIRPKGFTGKSNRRTLE